MKEVKRQPFLEPDHMKKLGFDLISDDGQYLKYKNDGTTHYNKDYNSECPEPKGKVLLYVNFGYSDTPFVSIEQDGGTRTVYHGVCASEDFLLNLLFSIR